MNFTKTKQHNEIVNHVQNMPHLRELLTNKQREKSLIVQNSLLQADFSRQRIDSNVLNLFAAMLDELNFKKWRADYFTGKKINHTENRPVLHTAMRIFDERPISVDGQDVVPEVFYLRKQMYNLAHKIRADKSIKRIIWIGIGGSDLGPRFLVDAFQDIADGPEITFVSNVDHIDIKRALENSQEGNTLFFVVSKTFTTSETMRNADTACAWANGNTNRFYAVTCQKEKAEAWGILPGNVLTFPEWVGGRFSLWSSVGLPLALSIGPELFDEFLQGAALCDDEFLNADIENNIPLLMALIGILNRNYYDYPSHVIAPYDTRLRYFSNYIQQMDMESNGKSVDRDRNIINYKTSPQVYGTVGTDCQHSYMQLLHQGSDVVPVDFISFTNCENGIYKDHHKLLLANMWAQANALAIGQTTEEAKGDIYRYFEGNRPNSVFSFHAFNAKSIGYLIAAYEHKIFAQGIMWNLNSYDQPGVELGKKMALEELSRHG